MINFDDFQKLDIKIGTIVEAEPVPETDKLLKLTVDLGNETRTLVAGIGDVYKPDEIKSKQVPILTNLEPRIIRGIESQGMILAIDTGGSIALLHPDKKIGNGAKVS